MSFYRLRSNVNYFIELLYYYYKYVTISRLLKLSYKSAVAGMRPQLLCLLCYSGGWITGLIALRIRNINSVVRFNAWQSIITFGIVSVILIVPVIVMKFIAMTSLTLALFLVILYWLVIAFTLSLWILLMYQSYRHQTYKLFLVGDMAWNLAGVDSENMFNDVESFSNAAIQEKPAVMNYPVLKKPAPEKLKVPLEMLHEIVNSMVTLYKNRDPYTASHQERVAQLACAIAREMGFPEDRIEGIRIMGIIHDIGKIAVPVEILSKSGKLNNYEMGIIKTHPEVAYKILKGLQFPWPVARAILQHHERLNGSGYPKGLTGSEILPEARILSVSDVVEAMATHRPYRPGLGIDEAIYEITRERDILYDPVAVDTCIKLFTLKGFTWDMQDNGNVLLTVPVRMASPAESV